MWRVATSRIADWTCEDCGVLAQIDKYRSRVSTSAPADTCPLLRSERPLSQDFGVVWDHAESEPLLTTWHPSRVVVIDHRSPVPALR